MQLAKILEDTPDAKLGELLDTVVVLEHEVPFDVDKTPNDPFDLAADYGTDGADVLIIDNGGHVPRLAEPEIVEAFWQAVFGFIDP